MKSFRVPIAWPLADPDPTGPIRRLLRARVVTHVERAPGDITSPIEFAIDSGAGYTMMSATLARSLGIPFPAATSRLGMRTAAGTRPVTVHDGELRLRFAPCPDHVYRLYCLFVEETPPSVPPVLGLNDTLDVFRLTFDGAWATDGQHGAVRFDPAHSPP